MTQTDISANLERVRARIAGAAERAGRRAEDVLLIGVSKTVEAERIRRAVEAGVPALGENRVQEAKGKIAIQLEDVTLDTALKLLTELADLSAVRVGSVVFVTSEARGMPGPFGGLGPALPQPDCSRSATALASVPPRSRPCWSRPQRTRSR